MTKKFHSPKFSKRTLAIKKLYNKKKIGHYSPIQASRITSSRRHFEQERKHKIKLAVSSFAVVLFIFVVIYVLFFTSILYIKNVKIVFSDESRLISENEIKNIVYSLMNEKYLYFLSRSNIILFKKNKLINITNKDSRIASLSVKRKLFPISININIKESIPVARLIILGDNNDYYLNTHGQVIIPPQSREYEDNEDRYFTTLDDKNKSEDIKDQIIQLDLNQQYNKLEQEITIKPPLLPLFYDKTSTNLNSPVMIELFNSILDFIKSNILTQAGINIKLIEIEYTGGLYDIKIHTSEGWQLFINSKADFNKQLNALDIILKNKIKKRQELEYIDLRFRERIFYKNLTESD